MTSHKNDNQQDYYAELQLDRKASQIEIINAYRQARLTYQQDALATYSLLGESDRQQMLDRIEEAYRILSDSELRKHYDEGENVEAPVNETTVRHDPNIIAFRPACRQHGPEMQWRIANNETFEGTFLRDIREALNISLQSIAGSTRIPLHYLQAFENEDTSGFPDKAFCKSYLGQYAKAIHIDPDLLFSRYRPFQD